jgi:tetratricopeptide (TPR) repeat protein
MWKRALAGYETSLEPDHPSTLAVVQNLGMLYHGQGKVEDAEKMWKRALAGYEKAFGPDKKVFDIQYKLGILYMQSCRLDEAEAALQGAQMGYEAILGPDDPETIDATDQLASVRGSRSNVVL